MDCFEQWRMVAFTTSCSMSSSRPHDEENEDSPAGAHSVFACLSDTALGGPHPHESLFGDITLLPAPTPALMDQCPATSLGLAVEVER